jgi:hypothetical protein
MKLLSINQDSKTIKGLKKGYLTGIMYLAPYTLGGKNICPFAKAAGCINSCLNTAGRGIFNSVQNARLNRTKLYHSDINAFMNKLAFEIHALKKTAIKNGLIPVIRLNGLSDIEFENIKFDHYDRFIGFNYQSITIFELFPDIQFYDYTKNPCRDSLPKNYDLTFSYSNKPEFKKFNEIAIKKGLRLAAVFSDQNLPAYFMGLPVLNGDESDLTFLAPKNTILGLYAKGKAKKDVSGFIIKTIPILAI